MELGFLQNNDTQTETPLIINNQLSTGKFKVYYVKTSCGTKEYAVKAFPKDKVAFSLYVREKQAYNTLSHENIIQYIPNARFKHREFDCDFIMTEYAPYGDFYGLVSEKGLRSEKVIRTYFHQMINALEHIHSKGMAHLDLKLSNLLVGKDFQLKVADFDQSQTMKGERLISGGTSNYRAPEIIEKNCTDIFSADIYSAAVILFVMVTGKFPFKERRTENGVELSGSELFNENREAFWEAKNPMPSQKDFFSQSFKDLISGMLEKDPQRRMTIEEIKASAWYNRSILDKEALEREMKRSWEKVLVRKATREQKSNSSSLSGSLTGSLTGLVEKERTPTV